MLITHEQASVILSHLIVIFHLSLFVGPLHLLSLSHENENKNPQSRCGGGSNKGAVGERRSRGEAACVRKRRLDENGEKTAPAALLPRPPPSATGSGDGGPPPHAYAAVRRRGQLKRPNLGPPTAASAASGPPISFLCRTGRTELLRTYVR